jgi:hypothetical protein
MCSRPSGSQRKRRVGERRIFRLDRESPDVTLAYLKGKNAESEKAQEHANSSSLALAPCRIEVNSVGELKTSPMPTSRY